MYKELLERLCKIQLVEAGDLIIPNASAIAHDPIHKQGVWWYDLVNKILLFNRTATHAEFEKFQGLKSNVDTAIWIKGRAFKYNGHNCILAYTDDFKEREIRLTGQMLADIVQKIQDESGLSVSTVVDEPGRLLYRE